MKMSCSPIGGRHFLYSGGVRDIPTLTPQTTVRRLTPFFYVHTIIRFAILLLVVVMKLA